MRLLQDILQMHKTSTFTVGGYLIFFNFYSIWAVQKKGTDWSDCGSPTRTQLQKILSPCFGNGFLCQCQAEHASEPLNSFSTVTHLESSVANNETVRLLPEDSFVSYYPACVVALTFV